MIWETKYKYIDQFEYVSTNQHGNRYKKTGPKRVSVVTMSTKIEDTNDMQTLTLLSHELNVPVHYDYEEKVAFIKVVSAESI